MSKLARVAIAVLVVVAAGCSSMGGGTGSYGGSSLGAQDSSYRGGHEN